MRDPRSFLANQRALQFLRNPHTRTVTTDITHLIITAIEIGAPTSGGQVARYRRRPLTAGTTSGGGVGVLLNRRTTTITATAETSEPGRLDRHEKTTPWLVGAQRLTTHP